jgi:multidrug efflux pump subunit AcrB
VANTPAMNTITLGVVLVGVLSLLSLRREVFPEFELEIILVTVPYPGASPEEVEDGICRKIEEAVRSIDGIKKQTAVAAEGVGYLVLELRTDVRDVQKVLGEVRSEIDRIPSFPLLAEDPEIKQITLRQPAINVAVLAPVKAESGERRAESQRRDERGESRVESRSDSTIRADSLPASSSGSGISTLDSGPSSGSGLSTLDSPLSSDSPLSTDFDHNLEAQLQLRDVAEQVRDELLQLPQVSQANILGERQYQIDIEISEDTLRKYGLTLQRVAQIVRRENIEMPGGNMKTESQTVLLRGKNKRITGEEIAQIPLITQPGGQVLRVGDLGLVRDAFEDTASINRINGRPGLVITVERTAKEDLLAIAEVVRNYVQTNKLPGGYELMYFADRSTDVKDRMDLLMRNGLQGLVLVFISLALFLNLRYAFWVAWGIPVSLLGACAVLYFTGETLNMLTMFAFIMALGIVVDDAIVISENIHSHQAMGKSPLRAAIDGTYEVLPSVTSSVATTVIAFVPLMFVAGIMGKFIAVMPFTMIAVLLFSLAEATFILPCHLGHIGAKSDAPLARIGRSAAGFVLYPFQRFEQAWERVNRGADRLLAAFIERIYMPVLHRSLRHPGIVASLAVAFLLITYGLYKGGFTPWELIPRLDNKEIYGRVEFPDGTPAAVTDQATRRLEEAILAVNRELSPAGESLIKIVHRSVGHAGNMGALGQEARATGDHVGVVNVELLDPSQRDVHSDRFLAAWRERAGDIPGAVSLIFDVPQMGPGGKPIEFKLLADARYFEELEDAVEAVKSELRTRPGVKDIVDDSKPGKWEYQLRVKERALAMGVPLADVAETVRAAYYGEEVMRLQRGRHEVKLMVRYPPEERGSLANFDEIRIRGNDGAERPITELAHVDVKPSLAEINRVDQLRSITVSADVEGETKGSEVTAHLQNNVLPAIFAEHPNVSVRWEGQQEQTDESVRSLIVGLAVALVAMFVLLTMEFRTYLQPLMIMAIIPFGVAGAVWGHLVFGLPISMFSLFGLVALTGVVVNDSIVLIDFINERIRGGMELREAIIDAGRRRFRPVLLTSLTTIAGLLPVVLERSLQAQIVIPMAVALCFGLIFSTVLVLVMVPMLYQGYSLLIGRAAPVHEEEEEPIVAAEN